MIQEKIPIHSIHKDSKIAIEVKRFVNVDSTKIHQKKPHRDDHYLLYFQEKGTSSVIVDFITIDLKAMDILCILPGQVHYGVSAIDSYAWSISLDGAFINEFYLPFFEELILQNKALSLEKEISSILSRNFELLNDLIENKNNVFFSQTIIKGLVDSCVGIFASGYHDIEEKNILTSRPLAIVREFKKLLLKSYVTIKSPSDYAKLLHISSSYLNESSKQVTGFPVSYWIQQQIIIEAKRALYYTNDTVKEIAYALGYEDATYFSRLFSNLVGMSALEFRKQSRI
ncbi:AraC family transcriptional regulator [Flavobacterium aestivum]|uniref:AraC family transcriptional regulator n=1 Tax=Flavobacterium aestivum TaxID=3003257 RepID=UPI00228687F4|nr:helix-turn-helix transcriptional regulator [Flavobacterium aestivum]